MIVELLTDFCLRHEIVTFDELPVFRYCIEKRLYSAIAFIPLFLCGIIWTNFATTIAFLCSFSYLRSTTNGFHAAKPSICFIISLLIELLLFKCVIPILNAVIVLTTIAICTFAIYVLSPFNHPNMDLSSEEISACRIESRKRLLILLFLLVASWGVSLADVFIGLFLGIALVAVLLCLAYISDWEDFLCSKKIRRL